MPNLPGSELAGRLLEIRKNIPILLTTGYSDRITREKALSMGIREPVYRPLDTAAVSGIVRNLLDA